MSRQILLLIVFALFFLSSNIYSFQGDGPPPPTIPPPVGLPASINDKILFLIVAGGFLGFFVLRKNKA